MEICAIVYVYAYSMAFFLVLPASFSTKHLSLTVPQLSSIFGNVEPRDSCVASGLVFRQTRYHVTIRCACYRPAIYQEYLTTVISFLTKGPTYCPTKPAASDSQNSCMASRPSFARFSRSEQKASRLIGRVDRKDVVVTSVKSTSAYTCHFGVVLL